MFVIDIKPGRTVTSICSASVIIDGETSVGKPARKHILENYPNTNEISNRSEPFKFEWFIPPVTIANDPSLLTQQLNLIL